MRDPDFQQSITSALPPGPVERRDAVARVLRDPLFAGTRAATILGYIADEMAAGREARLKAYTVATECLGRNSTFDPQTDSIVRVEATKLRKLLDLYYQDEGRADPVTIVLPRGSYILLFSWSALATGPELDMAAVSAPEIIAASAPSASRSRKRVVTLVSSAIAGLAALGLLMVNNTGFNAVIPLALLPAGAPLIAVMDFEEHGPQVAAQIESGRIFKARLVSAMRRFDLFQIVEGEQVGAVPTYRLRGTRWSESGETIKHLVTLTHVTTGSVVWTETVTLSADHSNDEAALQSILSPMMSPFGIIFSDLRARLTSLSLPGNRCLIQAFDSIADGDYGAARACLRIITVVRPSFAPAHALLARVLMIDHVISGDAQAGRDSLSHAHRARALSGDSQLAMLALAEAQYYGGNRAEGIRMLPQVIALNPNNAATRARVGRIYLLKGDTETGVAMLRDSARSIILNDNDLFQLFLAERRLGDLDAARRVAAQVGARQNPLGLLMRAIDCADRGDMDGASAEVRIYQDLFPDIARNQRAILLRIGIAMPETDAVMTVLTRAGLKSSTPMPIGRSADAR